MQNQTRPTLKCLSFLVSKTTPIRFHPTLFCFRGATLLLMAFTSTSRKKASSLALPASSAAAMTDHTIENTNHFSANPRYPSVSISKPLHTMERKKQRAGGRDGCNINTTAVHMPCRLLLFLSELFTLRQKHQAFGGKQAKINSRSTTKQKVPQ